MTRWLWLLITAWLAVAVPGAAQGISPSDTAARESARLSGTLMSPFCPGMTLSACPSPDAATLRAEISARLHRGEPVESIVADLETRFGDVLDGSPRRRGVGWLAWLLPVPLAGVLWLALRLAVGHPAPDRPRDDAPLTVEQHARLDEELDALP